MSSRKAPVVAAVLAVVLLAAAAVALLGGLNVTVTPTESVDPAAFADVPIVVSKQETGGFELFGIRFAAPDRSLGVALVPEDGCVLPGPDGEEILEAGDRCGTPDALTGPVQGGGTTNDGVRWVEVRVEASEACFEAAAVGEPWPAACGS